MPRFTIRVAGRVFRCEIDTGVNPDRNALCLGVGCVRSTVVKSEMSNKYFGDWAWDRTLTRIESLTDSVRMVIVEWKYAAQIRGFLEAG